MSAKSASRKGSDFPVEPNRLVVGLFLCIAILVYWPTWSGLVSKWFTDSGSYSHGFLVALVSCLIAFRNAPLASGGDDESWKRISGAGLLVCTVIWSAAHLAGVLLIQAALMPVIILLMFSCIFGKNGLRTFWFPALFLFTSIPVWFLLVPILQGVTIVVVSAFLTAVGVPSLLHGEFVRIPSGVFQIASGCAGLNFFLAALTIGSLFAYIEMTNWKYRLTFVSVVVIASVVMNWVRVSSIIIAGHLTEMQHYLVAVDHYYFGWALFALMLIPIFFFGRWMSSEEARREQCSIELPKESGGSIALATKPVVITALIAMLIPGTVHLVDFSNRSSIMNDLSAPELNDGWLFEPQSSGLWKPVFQLPDAEISGKYHKADVVFEVYLNRYQNQVHGRELVSSMNQVHGETDVNSINRATVPIATNDGVGEISVVLEEFTVESSDRYVLVYWYQIGTHSETDPLKAKIRELAVHFSAHPVSGLVALRHRCNLSCESARERLLFFVSNHGLELGHAVLDKPLRRVSSGAV